MFELEVNHERLTLGDCPKELIDGFSTTNKSIKGIAIIPWEEHCTECAMPQCYETCDLYEPRKDGKCRRFIGGISPISGISGVQNYFVRIKFKRWGQLLAYSNLHMVPTSRARLIERAVFFFDNIISRIPDQHISLLGRRSISSRMTRRFKQALTSKGWFKTSEHSDPDYFLIELFNPNNQKVDLSFTINTRDPNKYDVGYQKLLKINKGFNRFIIDIDEISNRVDLSNDISTTFNPNILNPEDEGLCLYFGIATFIWDASYKSRKSAEETIQHIKVVAWDLDNTVWDGILIEDGIENIKLKPGIKDIIKELDKRGILNTVVSKNNHEDAIACLKTLGIDEYILHPKIGWGQKGIYLKDLVNKFNVGENTVAFIDDSEFERDEAKSLNPAIRTYDAKDYMTLLERLEFNPETSSESYLRRSFYTHETEREKSLSSFNGDYLSFLNDCNITLNIFTPRINNLERINELVQRTNQLNFSGNRYQINEIEDLINDPIYDTFCLECEDKYGKYGIVGFAIVNNSTVRLIDFMLSCRVQSKRVEHAFISFLLNYYKSQNRHIFSAIYNATDRNIKAGEVFKDLNFKIAEDIEGRIIFDFNLTNVIPNDGIIRLLRDGKEWTL